MPSKEIDLVLCVHWLNSNALSLCCNHQYNNLPTVCSELTGAVTGGEGCLAAGFFLGRDRPSSGSDSSSSSSLSSPSYWPLSTKSSTSLGLKVLGCVGLNTALITMAGSCYCYGCFNSLNIHRSNRVLLLIYIGGLCRRAKQELDSQ
jgi:hypothetical protein